VNWKRLRRPEPAQPRPPASPDCSTGGECALPTYTKVSASNAGRRWAIDSGPLLNPTSSTTERINPIAATDFGPRNLSLMVKPICQNIVDLLSLWPLVPRRIFRPQAASKLGERGGAPQKAWPEHGAIGVAGSAGSQWCADARRRMRRRRHGRQRNQSTRAARKWRHCRRPTQPPRAPAVHRPTAFLIRYGGVLLRGVVPAVARPPAATNGRVARHGFSANDTTATNPANSRTTFLPRTARAKFAGRHQQHQKYLDAAANRDRPTLPPAPVIGGVRSPPETPSGPDGVGAQLSGAVPPVHVPPPGWQHPADRATSQPPKRGLHVNARTTPASRDLTAMGAYETSSSSGENPSNSQVQLAFRVAPADVIIRTAYRMKRPRDVCGSSISGPTKPSAPRRAYTQFMVYDSTATAKPKMAVQDRALDQRTARDSSLANRDPRATDNGRRRSTAPPKSTGYVPPVGPRVPDRVSTAVPGLRWQRHSTWPRGHVPAPWVRTPYGNLVDPAFLVFGSEGFFDKHTGIASLRECARGYYHAPTLTAWKRATAAGEPTFCQFRHNVTPRDAAGNPFSNRPWLRTHEPVSQRRHDLGQEDHVRRPLRLSKRRARCLCLDRLFCDHARRATSSSPEIPVPPRPWSFCQMIATRRPSTPR